MRHSELILLGNAFIIDKMLERLLGAEMFILTIGAATTAVVTGITPRLVTKVAMCPERTPRTARYARSSKPT